MNRDQITHYLPLLKVLFVGLLLGSLIGGGLALNAVILTLLIAALLLATRADVLQALIVIVIGAAIVVLFPQFSFLKLDAQAIVACCVVVLML